MKILTAGQMREMDRLTVERCGITYLALMESAGTRVVEAIIDNYGPVEGKLFRIYCGKGNNGGDGAVVARLLWIRGARVILTLLGDFEAMVGEARINMEMVKQIALSAPGLIFVSTGGTLSYSDELGESFSSQPDFVVDAVFGTGLARPVEGRLAELLSEYQGDRGRPENGANGTKVISIDIPSGLPSDSGRPIGPHFGADLTVTFTAPKIGNVDAPACHANGKLVVASIGTPRRTLESDSGSFLELVEERRVAEWLNVSRRAPDAHKGSVGDVLIIAGSRGKTGAAALTSETALRVGVGLVTVATAKSAQSLLITQARNEVMTEALDELDSGAISHAALDRALQLAGKRTVLAVGPGLSSTDGSTRRFVREFVERRPLPLVLDADGLNALSPWPEDLKGSRELPIIITPHPGEMARLTGKTNAEVIADRISLARDFAMKHHLITVLKGSRTIIASPEGEVYLNPTGNAGMATAGSGDVLTGLTAGLLAQRTEDPLNAVIAGVYLHGLAGDIAADKLGQRSLIASDIIDYLDQAILRVGGDRERGQPNTIITI